jgi:hypothetical protein
VAPGVFRRRKIKKKPLLPLLPLSNFQVLIIFFFDLLDELGKTRFLRKKNPSLCRLSKNVVRGITFSPFNLETFPFGVSNIFVLCGVYVYWFFRHFDESLRVAPEQKFGFFKVSTLKLLKIG